jgi:hypothetical protein
MAFLDWGLIFESMWTKQREKINIVKAQIQRHTLLLRREVGLEHIQEAQNAQLQALEHYEKSEKSFRRQEYQAVKTYISPTTYEHKLDSFHARICQGTGQWLLRDTTFAKWLDKADASMKILWLQGIPGAGACKLTQATLDVVINQAVRKDISIKHSCPQGEGNRTDAYHLRLPHLHIPR